MPLQEHLHPPLMLSGLTESFQMYVRGLKTTVYSFFRYMYVKLMQMERNTSKNLFIKENTLSHIITQFFLFLM